jgi:hypothetical protein
MLGQHLLTWKSSKQTTIFLSTTEAKYKALLDLGRELAWLSNLLDEIGVKVKVTEFEVLADNRGAIDLAKSKTSQNSFRTKHMSIKLHFVRELLETKLITLNYVKSNANATDFVTKPCGRTTIRRSLEAVHLLPSSQPASHLSTRSTAGCQNP